MTIKDRFLSAFRLLPQLKKQVFSVAAGIFPALIPCALILALIACLAAASAQNSGLTALLSLVSALAVTPLTAAAIAYAASARWESRTTTFADCVQLARIRLRGILITGLTVGLITLVLQWVATSLSSLIGIVPALLGWLPAAGKAISLIASCLIRLISLTLEFAAHLLLVMGMLPLAAEGMSGHPQAARALGVFKGGGQAVREEFFLLFLLWVAVCILTEGIAWALPGGIIIASALTALRTAFSMTAVSVVYLKERDRQDGSHFTV